MKRKYNFSPGPATMPEPVLKKISEEFFCHPDLDSSIVELSHRSKFFLNIIEEAKAKVLKLAGLGNNYQVLFLQGGASAEFFRVPMNLLQSGKKASYINTGAWTKKAIKEAKIFGEVIIAGTSEDAGFKHIPKDIHIDPASQYVYLCSNNTIFGTQYQSYPSTNIPLVGDFTSDFLCREIDLSNFGIILVGAQKNLGIAGLSTVLIRDDVLAKCREDIPSMCSYPVQVKENSTYNTSPVFAIYFTHAVLNWMEEQGGVKAIEKQNREKVAMVYDALDRHSIYTPYAEKTDRSIMNITFNLPDDEKTAAFLKGAEAYDLMNLKGHRSVGGIRASMYNAFPMEGAQVLAKYLNEFAEKN